MDHKPSVLFYAPVPPPFAGPEVASQMLMEAFPGERVTLLHVRSNIRAENVRKGILDVAGVVNFLGVYKEFLRTLLTKSPNTVYLLLSSGIVGFLRDSVIILTAKGAGKRVVAHYRGGNFHKFYAQRRKVFQSVIRLVLSRIDRLIVQAERLRLMFSGIVDDSRIRVLYNGMPASTGGSSIISPGGRPFTLLFIGHVAFSKGFYDLILAYMRLRNKHPIRLLFAGERRFEGRARKGVKAFLTGQPAKFFSEHALHVEETIHTFVEGADRYGAHYLGLIDGSEKERAFADSDAFVLPSYTEGFSMSVLEAMDHGLPVVATTVGALPEVVRDGENGFLVHPGDCDALTGAIETLVLDRPLGVRMGNRNREYVRESFRIERIAQEFEGILAEVGSDDLTAEGANYSLTAKVAK